MTIVNSKELIFKLLRNQFHTKQNAVKRKHKYERNMIYKIRQNNLNANATIFGYNKDFIACGNCEPSNFRIEFKVGTSNRITINNKG